MDSRDLPICGMSFVSSIRLHDVDMVCELKYNLLERIAENVAAWG